MSPIIQFHIAFGPPFGLLEYIYIHQLAQNYDGDAFLNVLTRTFAHFVESYWPSLPPLWHIKHLFILRKLQSSPYFFELVDNSL